MSPASQIGANQILDESLTSADIKNGTVAEVDLTAAVQLKLNAGDMLKSVYDTNANGIVDNADALVSVPGGSFARRDVGNTFAARQFFSGGISGQLTGAAGQAAKGMFALVFPRDADFTSINQDYQDELALGHLNPAWTIGLSSAAGVGSANALFIDDSTSFTGTGTVFPVVVTADFSVAPIPNRANGYFRLGLTLRGSVIPTSVLIETWNGTAWATVVNATGLTIADFPGGLFWLSPQFFGNTTNYNMERIRLTVDGVNPVASPFYLQRMILYHATAPINPWHLHKLGGTMYGDANWQIGTVKVGGNNVWHAGNLTQNVQTVRTVTASGTIATADSLLLANAASGAQTQTLPSAVTTPGKTFTLKKTDASVNAVTLATTSSQTIDGALTFVLKYQGNSVTVVSDGVNWAIQHAPAPALLGTGTPTVSSYLNGLGAWASTSAFARLDIDNVFTGSNTQKALTLVNQPISFSTSFTQAAGPLPADWVRGTTFTATNPNPIIGVGNVAGQNMTGADILAYLPGVPMIDGTIQALVFRGSGLTARYNPNGSGYTMLMTGTGTTTLLRHTPGVVDTVLSTISGALPASATYKLTVTGSTIQMYENGVLIGTVVDTTYTSGFPAMYCMEAAGATFNNQLDDYSFVPANLIVNPPAGQSLLYAEAGILKLRDSAGAVTAYGAGGATATVGNPAYANISAAYAIKTTDYYLFASAATAAFSATLPTAVGVGGKSYTLFKTDSTANSVTMATVLGQTIGGQSTVVLTFQNSALSVVSDNVNWQVT